VDRSAAHGTHLRIPRSQQAALRVKEVKPLALVMLATQADGVRFTTAALRALSNDHASVHAEYMAAQADVQAKVVEVAATYLALLEQVSEVGVHAPRSCMCLACAFVVHLLLSSLPVSVSVSVLCLCGCVAAWLHGSVCWSVPPCVSVGVVVFLTN
jgi:hypothetical protein